MHTHTYVRTYNSSLIASGEGGGRGEEKEGPATVGLDCVLLYCCYW